MSSTQQPLPWRPALALRAVAGAVILAGLLGAIALMIWAITSPGWGDWFGEEWPGWGFLALPIIAGPLILLWRITIVPYIEAREEGLYIRNPFRILLISWPEILDCEPGYYGLTIRRADGEEVTAVAVQKWNAAEWFHLQTKADRVCDYIKSRTLKGPERDDAV